MKIFESFVRTKPKIMYRYLFEEHKEILSNFKNHLYLRSIAEAFSKVLVFSSDDMGSEQKYETERL